MKLPESKNDRENRRGCFTEVAVLIAILAGLAIAGINAERKPAADDVALSPTPRR